MIRISGLLVAVLLLVACGANPLSRKYEYEEEVYVELDGSATVYVNAAVPALVALRGAALPVDPAARLDRQAVRALYDAPASRVASVSVSRRDGRRYVHVRLDVPDVRQLSDAPMFAWSDYRFTVEGDSAEYAQSVRAAAGGDVGEVGWNGQERVAFRLHLPSRVTFHNAPSREILRGNIIVWEQSLEERRQGRPVDIQVRMGSESILASTLLLFAAMIGLVALTFAVFIWFIKRREPAETAGQGGRPSS